MKYFLQSFSFFSCFKKGCCQLQAKICAWSTGLWLCLNLPMKSAVRLTSHLGMTVAADWDV